MSADIREVTVNTKSSTVVSITWPAGCMAAIYLSSHMNVHCSKCKCTECGKCFSSKPVLASCKRSHSGEKSFECTVCSKQFMQSEHLVVHGRIHRGEKLYKYQCDESFCEFQSFNTHLIVHTGAIYRYVIFQIVFQ